MQNLQDAYLCNEAEMVFIMMIMSLAVSFANKAHAADLTKKYMQARTYRKRMLVYISIESTLQCASR